MYFLYQIQKIAMKVKTIVYRFYFKNFLQPISSFVYFIQSLCLTIFQRVFPNPILLFQVFKNQRSMIISSNIQRSTKPLLPTFISHKTKRNHGNYLLNASRLSFVHYVSTVVDNLPRKTKKKTFLSMIINICYILRA